MNPPGQVRKNGEGMAEWKRQREGERQRDGEKESVKENEREWERHRERKREMVRNWRGGQARGCVRVRWITWEKSVRNFVRSFVSSLSSTQRKTAFRWWDLRFFVSFYFAEFLFMEGVPQWKRRRACVSAVFVVGECSHIFLCVFARKTDRNSLLFSLFLKGHRDIFVFDRL